MRTPNPTRKAAFKAALAYAGMTAKQWREEREPPITATHLNEVLSGNRISAALTADVDAFIAAHTPRHIATAA